MTDLELRSLGGYLEGSANGTGPNPVEWTYSTPSNGRWRLRGWVEAVGEEGLGPPAPPRRQPPPGTTTRGVPGILVEMIR